MSMILAQITSLAKHIQHLNARAQDYRPSQCPHCHKAGVWVHGCYGRAADRDNKTGGRMNPVPIPRFLCPHCQKTCSTLPECIPPRRWYLWTFQMVALHLLLTGKHPPWTRQSQSPARATIRRWMDRFLALFSLHADTLRAIFPELGRTNGFHEFWRACLDKMSLSAAMVRLHENGVPIP